ncbi:MAG: phosphoglycolate phosphatase [Parashewanella sp.]
MNSLQLKAIAFDLDGTLVDSVPDLAAATQAMLSELELNLCTEQQVRTWVGNGAEMLVKRALTYVNMGEPTAKQLSHALAVFLKHYKLHLNKHSRLYSGVKNTLERLHQQGYQLAIITNKPFQFISPLLAAFEIEPYFDLILGGDSLAEKKPNPLPINHILTQWKLDKSQLLMVGDSKNDIVAAKSAGIASIGLTYGYNYGEDIGLYGPNAVFDEFESILSWINQHT